MPSLFRVLAGGCVALAAASTFATGAIAQPVELEIRSNRDFEHEWTPMEFPARIGDFRRNRIIQFEEREANIAANYWSDETETILSIYIYRPAKAHSAIWFDRAMFSLGAHGVLGEVDLDDIKVGTFVPSGGSASSGQYAVMKVDGEFSSTAVALYQAGEWLVKLRISSQTLSVGDMSELVLQSAANLPALDRIGTQNAYFVAPCSTERPDSGASQVEADASAGLALALSDGERIRDTLAELRGVSVEEVGTPVPVKYCREGERSGRFNTYRPNERLDSYFMAIGDSGFGISVGPDALQGLMGEEAGREVTYSVQSSTGLETTLHAVFDNVPSLQQAADAVFEGGRVAAVNRTLGDENPTIQLFVETEED